MPESNPKNSVSRKSKVGMPERCKHTSHGFYAIQKTLGTLSREKGENWLSELGPVGNVLREWIEEIIRDLGGEETVSAQQRAIVEVAAKTFLLLESLDRYLLGQRSIVNKRKRAVYPVVIQRQQLADSLTRHMSQLGLEKRQKLVPSLQDYLAKRGTQ